MIDFKYTVRSSSRRKTVGISVSRENQVTIMVPRGLAEDRIRQVVEKNARWIKSKICQNLDLQSRFQPKKYIAGETFPYLGESYTLQILPGRADVKINSEKTLLVHVPEELSSAKQEMYISERLEEWYKTRAVEKICERVRLYAELLRVRPSIVRVKELKSRWGSCSGKGNISLNWKLILAPLPILDYVVTHELCHLVHHDHSIRFWNLLRTILPDCNARRDWLKANEHTLTL